MINIIINLLLKTLLKIYINYYFLKYIFDKVAHKQGINIFFRNSSELEFINNIYLYSPA